MTCPHDAAEMDTAAHADGMCPLCMAAEIEAAEARIEWLEAENERLRTELSEFRNAAADEMIKLRAEIERLEALVKELADELEAEVEGHYRETKDYPSEQRRYERDMDPVRRARAALARKEGT